MARRGFIGLLLVIAAALLATGSAHADWLSKLIVAGERAATKGAGKGLGTLDHVASHLKSLPPAPAKSAALGATVSQEGHWTFVNRVGEKLTASNADEMRRVLTTLAPEASGADGRLTLLLTENAVFDYPAALKELPRGAALELLVDKYVYRLVPRSDAGTVRYHVELRANVIVELGERRLFDEAAWQLARPLETAGIRILSLDQNGPSKLSAVPKVEPATKRALSDPINPDRFPSALASIRGQTVIVTGRLDGPLLYFKASVGAERSVVVADLVRAAEAADVNLIVLKSASPSQPGIRNWLWQRIEIDGLGAAFEKATVADFMSALAGQQRQLVVQVAEQANGRVSLGAIPVRLPSAIPFGDSVGGVLSEIVSDIAGKVVTSGIEANLRSSERQRELDQRIVPGLPSGLQFSYLGLAVLGLFGLPVLRRWWARLWPVEDRTEYGHAFGYWAARAVRSLVFLVVFLPLVAIPAALWNMALQLRGWLMLAGRAWRWLRSARA